MEEARALEGCDCRSRGRRFDVRLADRFARLGTGTAFAMAAEAHRHAEQGARVFPFHLGDMDLKTPECIVEAARLNVNDESCSNHFVQYAALGETPRKTGRRV